MASDKQRLDGEINYRVLIRLTIGLMALLVVAMSLMWVLASSLFEREKAQDPPPPLMIEARVQHLPPEPRLQSHPFADYDLLRARHEERLRSYGWVNEEAGVAHIPIDEAMDLLVVHGLPTPPAASAAVEEPAGD